MGIWGQGAGMEDDAQADCCVHTDLGVPWKPFWSTKIHASSK